MYTFGRNTLGQRFFGLVTSIRTNTTCSYKVQNVLNFEDIPAAKSLPIFGTTLDLIAAGSAPQLHKYIDKRHKQLGPIFRERLGPISAVFVSSPVLMRNVFLYEGQYPTHPLPEAWTLYNQKKKCRRGLFFMDGEEWLQNRRIMNKILLSNTSWMTPLCDRATQKLINKWFDTFDESLQGSSEIPNLEEIMYKWAINVIANLMFGDPYKNISKELEATVDAFSEEVHKIFEFSSKLMSFPPKIAEFLQMKIWTVFEKSVDEVLTLGRRIIDMGLSEISDGNGMITMMKESNMSLEDIKRIFIDLIIAAGDTTAFSAQWALYLISTHNEIQNRIRSEISTLSHDEESPYIRGLIRETLRLYPVAPFIGRFLATDAVLGNYKINKNTLVLLSLYTSGRDAQSFPEPLYVKPERWLRNENRELCGVLQAHGTLPFAIGSRSCIGRKIAILQMHSLLKAAVQNFELKCLNDQPIDIILRLVAVPDKRIQLGIRPLMEEKEILEKNRDRRIIENII